MKKKLDEYEWCGLRLLDMDRADLMGTVVDLIDHVEAISDLLEKASDLIDSYEAAAKDLADLTKAKRPNLDYWSDKTGEDHLVLISNLRKKIKGKRSD